MCVRVVMSRLRQSRGGEVGGESWRRKWWGVRVELRGTLRGDSGMKEVG